MKQIITALILLSLFSLTAKAQREMTLNGYITLTGGEALTYKLVFTDSGGAIKGYSLTILDKDYEAKTAITGRLDKKLQTLSFTETDIIYTHGNTNGAQLCLIKAVLKDIATGQGHILKGIFTSADVGNTSCGSGEVKFTNSNIINGIFLPSPTDVVEAPKPRGIVVTENIPAAPVVTTTATQKVTEGIDRTYEWHNNTVIVDIWDGGNIDGDMVTLLYNGQPILEHYILTREKKEVHIPLSVKGTDVLTIVADNEGSEPKNTASMLLIDGDTKYSVLAYNTAGKKAVIKIKRADVNK